jgi:hypothetical protein
MVLLTNHALKEACVRAEGHCQASEMMASEVTVT